ncbi:LamB/YcsF family protein [Catenulispora yoronensis]
MSARRPRTRQRTGSPPRPDPPGGDFRQPTTTTGPPTLAEVFAPRAYTPRGTQVPRSTPGALLSTPEEPTARGRHPGAHPQNQTPDSPPGAAQLHYTDLLARFGYPPRAARPSADCPAPRKPSPGSGSAPVRCRGMRGGPGTDGSGCGGSGSGGSEGGGPEPGPAS